MHPYKRTPDVSVVITFHNEGLLAHKSLLSLSRCRASAERSGLRVEIIATLDRADEETERVVSGHDSHGRPDILLPLNVGDLGTARNGAVQMASGRWVLVCDGDDYLSEDFISRCVQDAANFDEDTILHPELIVFFDGWYALGWQTGDDSTDFDPACMMVCNPWNSCSFARRRLYADTPYIRARPGESGFGFEDWHWNCETLARGHSHRIARGTAHYVRRKIRDSLNAAHERHHALIPRTHLFDIGP